MRGASSSIAATIYPSTFYETRCRIWEEDGTWERIWRSLLALLDELGKLEWATALLDGSFVPAKKGETG
jgi:hypothetical protein